MASLDQREQRRDKTKDGCWTSGILQTGQLSYLAVNMLYPSREGKNNPEGDSEIISAAVPTICLGHSAQRARLFSFSGSEGRASPWFQGAGPSLPCASDAGLKQNATGWGCCPEGGGRATAYGNGDDTTAPVGPDHRTFS